MSSSLPTGYGEQPPPLVRDSRKLYSHCETPVASAVACRGDKKDTNNNVQLLGVRASVLVNTTLTENKEIKCKLKCINVRTLY